MLITVLLLTVSLFAVSCRESSDKKVLDEQITITFTVVHSDKSEKSFTITTDQKYLRGALEQEGLISGDDSSYGLFVMTVDSETVSSENESWWCLYEGDEQALSGVDSVEIKDGGIYSFVYTVGYSLK